MKNAFQMKISNNKKASETQISKKHAVHAGKQDEWMGDDINITADFFTMKPRACSLITAEM